MNERDARLRNRAALPRHRGHDAGLEGPRSGLVAADDYIGFCDGLRQICGIDLLQYKPAADGAASALASGPGWASRC